MKPTTYKLNAILTSIRIRSKFFPFKLKGDLAGATYINDPDTWEILAESHVQSKQSYTGYIVRLPQKKKKNLRRKSVKDRVEMGCSAVIKQRFGIAKPKPTDFITLC